MRRQNVRSRTHGNCPAHQHQESLPLCQRRTEEEQEEGRRAREEGQSSDHRRGRRGGAGIQPGHRRQGIHRAGRPLRLRQIHDPAHGRGPRGDHRRRAADRRQADEQRGPEGPRHRDGLPELRPVSAHDRLREHGLLPEAAPHPEGRDRPEGPRGARDPGYHPVSAPQAEGPLRRPAPARRHRPRDRARAERSC